MNTELNKEAKKSNKEKIQGQASKKHKRRNVKKKAFKPSVVYSDTELLTVDNNPFFNAIHQGEIKSITDDGITVSIDNNGRHVDAFVAKEELCDTEKYSVKEQITVYLEENKETTEEEDHPLKASRVKAIELGLLDKLAKAKENNQTVKGYIIGEIKGGYSVALLVNNREEADNGLGLRAFLPLGRTSLRRGEGFDEREDHLIEVHISELEPRRGNIVVSRRELLVEDRKKKEEAFFSNHAVGDKVDGVVSAVMPYGVFVDLDGVDGFLHISDISWDKKPKLKEVTPVGKEITAKIIELDTENKKVKLSIKELNEDPWQTIEKAYKPGTEVKGTVVAFADFGAFIRLEDGVEGLIHVGEITWNRIKHPSQYFKIGDEVKAAVLRVDKEAKRISLSTKALQESPVERLSGQFPVGTVIKTKVAGIHDFGIFVDLDEESKGLVPKSEVSWVRNDDPLDKSFAVDQELEVAVLGYDSKRQRVTCSIKRLQEDPWPNWKTKFKKGSMHKVKVTQVKRAGVVCELDKNLTAFCSRNHLADSGEEAGPMKVKVGDELEVVVTQFDMLRHRISISQKAAQETHTQKAYESYLSEQEKGGSKTTLADALKNINKK